MTLEVLGQVPAEELSTRQIIIDPEGNEATVYRAQLIDHERVRLSTDLGVAVVPRGKKFPVLG